MDAHEHSRSAWKEKAKCVLARSPVAYKTVERLYENALYVPHVARQGLGRMLLRLPEPDPRHGQRQAILTWKVPFHSATGSADLIAWLRSSGVRVHEGGHTIYVPPQEALRAVIPAIVAFYPDQAGFKILRDLRHPREARYLYKHRRSLRLLTRLIGTPEDQLVAANYMYTLGIGPRVWDLACWESDAARCTVFVVDHVAGQSPTADQCQQFLTRLRRLNATTHLRVLIPHWEQNPDFEVPDCNGNLIQPARLDSPQYVDFQNFGVTGLASSAATSEIGDEWHDLLDTLCRERLLDLRGRVVLDVGCGTGGAIAAALSHGAAWVVGWCTPHRTAAIDGLLLPSGATRYSLVTDRHTAERRVYDVLLWRVDADSPDGIAPEALIDVPWQMLVCDRLQHERIVRHLAKATTSVRFDVLTTAVMDRSGSPITIIRRVHA